MPTHEDIFLLQLIMEQGLISPQAIHNPLCQFCLYESNGKSVSLANILDHTNVIPHNKLQDLQIQVRQILNDVYNTRKPKPKVTPEQCVRNEILGKNTIGISYAATHSGVGACVVKYIEGVIAKNKSLLRYLLTTVERTKNIEHPHWGTVYTVDTNKGIIIRQFVAGETLEIRLLQGPLFVPEATQLLYQIISALKVAHQQGILHKNLKPSNIIITEQGQAVVVDAGLPPSVPQYLSPEQCQKKKADVRADIYSLGLIYYQSLIGSLPYSGSTIEEISHKISLGISPLQDTHPEIPEEIAQIVHKMLQFNHVERYQNYSQLLLELGNWLGISEDNTTLEPQDLVGEPFDSRQILNAVMNQSTEEVTAEPVAETDWNAQQEQSSTSATTDIPSSVDVIKHQRGRRIAEEIVHNIETTFAKEIQHACAQGKFYEELENVIAAAKKQFQTKMSPTLVDNMPYVEEAFERVRKQVTSQIEATPATDEQASGKKDNEFMDAVSVAEPGTGTDETSWESGVDPVPATDDLETQLPALPQDEDFDIPFGAQSSLRRADNKVRSLSDAKAALAESKSKQWGAQAETPPAPTRTPATTAPIQESEGSVEAPVVSRPASEAKLKPFFKPKAPLTPVAEDTTATKTGSSSAPTSPATTDSSFITSSAPAQESEGSVEAPVISRPASEVKLKPFFKPKAPLTPVAEDTTATKTGSSSAPTSPATTDSSFITSSAPAQESESSAETPVISRPASEAKLKPFFKPKAPLTPVDDTVPQPTSASLPTSQTNERTVALDEKQQTASTAQPPAATAGEGDAATPLRDILKPAKLSRPAFLAAKFGESTPKNTGTQGTPTHTEIAKKVNVVPPPAFPAKLAESLEAVRISEKQAMAKASSDSVDATPVSSDSVDATPASSDSVDATPVSSDSVDATPVSSDSVDATPVSSDSVDATPASPEADPNAPNPKLVDLQAERKENKLKPYFPK